MKSGKEGAHGGGGCIACTTRNDASMEAVSDDGGWVGLKEMKKTKRKMSCNRNN
jgi:hypothetical protein